MDIAQARREIGRWVKVFKAVEHMEEALAAATGIEETVASMKREKLALANDISKLEREKNDKIVANEQQYAQWSEQTKIRKEDYDRQLKDYNKAYREAKSIHDFKLRELDDKLKAKLADNQRSLAKLSAEREEAQEAVSKATQELEKLRNRLANVG